MARWRVLPLAVFAQGSGAGDGAKDCAEALSAGFAGGGLGRPPPPGTGRQRRHLWGGHGPVAGAWDRRDAGGGGQRAPRRGIGAEERRGVAALGARGGRKGVGGRDTSAPG